MKKLTHITFHLVAISFLLTTLTSGCMDQPQQPAQTNTNKSPILVEVYIAHITYDPFVYNRVHFPAQWEREIIKDILGIEISIKDLIISVMLKQAAQTTANDYKIIVSNNLLLLPARYFFNCSTDSTRDITINKHPVRLIYKNNPLIDNKEVHKQFKTYMKTLYNNPVTGMYEDPEKELIPQGIFTKKVLPTNHIIRHPSGSISITPDISWQHGINGCSKEIDLAKKVAAETIKPYGGSFHQLVTHRQTGGVFARELSIPAVNQLLLQNNSSNS